MARIVSVEERTASTMLARYSSPKKAYEMACLHAYDSANPDYWMNVAKEIRRIARLAADGNPAK